MNINGCWQNRETKEIIKFFGIQGTDEYLLEYDKDFNTSERVQIFKSDNNHALLVNSNKFGRQNIIYSTNKIIIGEIEFDKHQEKG